LTGVVWCLANGAATSFIAVSLQSRRSPQLALDRVPEHIWGAFQRY
jgi:hypothetical protein